MEYTKKEKDRKKRRVVLDELTPKAGGRLEADMLPDGGRKVSYTPKAGGTGYDSPMFCFLHATSIISIYESIVSNDTEMTQRMSSGQRIDVCLIPYMFFKSDSNVSDDTEMTQSRYIHPVMGDAPQYIQNQEWHAPLSWLMTFSQTQVQKGVLSLSDINTGVI